MVPSPPQALTNCSAGTYDAAASNTAELQVEARVCTACGPLTYSDRPNMPACTPQPACVAGTRYVEGDAQTSGSCVACGPASYQDDVAHHETECKTHAGCAAGEYFVELNARRDRLCLQCPTPGSYGTSDEDHQVTTCTDQVVCGAGEYYIHSSVAEGSCAPCSAMSYQASAAHRIAECTPQVPCVEAETVFTDSNSSAATCTACPTGMHQPLANHTVASCSCTTPETQKWYDAESAAPYESGFAALSAAAVATVQK